MKTIGFKLDVPYMIWATSVALVCTLLGVLLGQLPIAIAVAVVVIVTTCVTVNHRTLSRWFRARARDPKRDRNKRAIIDAEEGVLLWDAEDAAASRLIEISQPPLAVTRIFPDGSSDALTLPIDELRDELVQFDIHCESIDIHSYGYRALNPGKALSQMAIRAPGSVAALPYGRCFAEVTLSMRQSLNSMQARQDRAIPIGVAAATAVAVERVRRRLAGAGWVASPITAETAVAFHDDVLRDVLPHLEDEEWRQAGKRSAGSFVAFSPMRSRWTPTRYREWMALMAQRTLTTLHLERDPSGLLDRARFAIGYITSNRSDLATASTTGLRRENGHHGDVLTAVLPGARTVEPRDIASHSFGRDEQFTLPLLGPGIGTYLGESPKADKKIFLNLLGGGRLWVVGHPLLLQQLLGQIAPSGMTIDVRVPGELWRRTVTEVLSDDAPNVTYTANANADILVLDEQTARSVEVRGSQTVLIYSASRPPMTMHNSLVLEQRRNGENGRTEYLRVLTVGRERELLAWNPSPTEMQMYPQERSPQSDRAPQGPVRVGAPQQLRPAPPETTS